MTFQYKIDDCKQQIARLNRQRAGKYTIAEDIEIIETAQKLLNIHGTIRIIFHESSCLLKYISIKQIKISCQLRKMFLGEPSK